MVVLQVIDKYPTSYQNYLAKMLNKLALAINIKLMIFDRTKKADHAIVAGSSRDYLFRLMYKVGLSKYNNEALRLMYRYPIVHLQHSYLFPKVIPILNDKGINRPRIVITLRGGDTYLKPWIHERWYNFFKLYGNRVDAFITMSENQKLYLQKWGVDNNRIHVIPISFGERSSSLPKYPNSEKIKIVSAFRMTWEKNILGNIILVKLLRDKGYKIEYDVFGDGADLSEVYYLTNKYSLADVINIKGRVDNEQLKEKLPEYDFFLQLSISEALAASVIEAQSKGVPAIVSMSGGLPEAVLKDTSAIVEDYNSIVVIADKVIDLWRNKELYFSYSKAAIQNANDKFSIENELERLVVLYKQIIQVNGSRK